MFTSMNQDQPGFQDLQVNATQLQRDLGMISWDNVMMSIFAVVYKNADLTFGSPSKDFHFCIREQKDEAISGCLSTAAAYVYV